MALWSAEWEEGCSGTSLFWLSFYLIFITISVQESGPIVTSAASRSRPYIVTSARPFPDSKTREPPRASVGTALGSCGPVPPFADAATFRLLRPRTKQNPIPSGS